MSKKLLSTEKWKRYLKKRQDYQLRKIKKAKAGSRTHFQPKRITPQHKRTYLEIEVPRVFSLVSNPREMLNFLARFRFYATRYNLTLRLEGITELTSDAIAVLVATVHLVAEYANVRGNLPTDPAVRNVLVQAGFFDHVRSVQPIQKTTQGKIVQEKQGIKVEPTVARDLIRIGTSALHGSHRRSHGVYRTLIECMANTHNHAAKPNRRKETWWSNVYSDGANNKICYTFVDIGVGIFGSVRLSRIRRFYRKFGIEQNTRVMRDILEGKVQSSTGLEYRGKGLPAIYRLAQTGTIKSLTIISNNVFAKVSEGQYTILDSEFDGTLLYWETS